MARSRSRTTTITRRRGPSPALAKARAQLASARRRRTSSGGKTSMESTALNVLGAYVAGAYADRLPDLPGDVPKVATAGVLLAFAGPKLMKGKTGRRLQDLGTGMLSAAVYQYAKTGDLADADMGNTEIVGDVEIVGAAEIVGD